MPKSDTKQHEYDSKSIVVMKDIDHIRENRHLYDGGSPTYNHLIYEILDNSVDEVSNKFADTIKIIINTETNQISVADNGRGIPVSKKDGEYIPFLISTKLFSSGKSKEQQGKNYKLSAGLHGIGLTLVNALSKVMAFQVYRNGKEYSFILKNGEPLKHSDKLINSNTTGTIITIIPDSKYFETPKVELKELIDRLVGIRYSLGNNLKKLTLIVDNKEIELPKQDYFQYIFNKPESGWISNIVNKSGIEFFEIKMSFDEHQLENLTQKGRSAGMKFHSILNNIPMTSEGTHIKFAIKCIKDAFYQIAQKLKYNELIKDDFTKGLLLFVNVGIVEKHFNSQDKKKLTTELKYFEERFSKLTDVIKQILLSDEYFEKITKPYIEILHSYKLNLGNKNLKSVKHSSTGVSRALGIPQLNDCMSRSTEDTILYIVEGDSAGGHVLDIRDKQKHAVFYLTGKPLNVATSKIQTVLKNKVISALIQAIGVGYHYKTSKVKLENIRYEKIVILTDADSDGVHIRNLLLIMFGDLMPELLQEGKVYVSEQPLYKAKIKKGVIDYCYSFEELQEKYPNVKFQRFKGLGEMEAKDLKHTLFGKWERNIQVTFENYEEEIEIFKKLMQSTEYKVQLNKDLDIISDNVIDISSVLGGSIED